MKWYRWEARWSNPYTAPPDGQPRIRATTQTPYTAGSSRTPPEIAAAAPIGSGYCVAVSVTDDQPPRRFSQAAKARIRRRNLERRIQRRAPLFAAELLQAELDRRPEYFAGADVPH